MSRRRTGAIAAALATLTTIAAIAVASASAAPANTIVIGWAFDGNGAMAPFDGPALAAAQIRVKQVNARGGVNGKKLRIATCDTQGNKPAIARACAAKLLSQGANVIFTTCDVDFATPVVQEAINRGVLAVAPCIGTDQMGPKRFGAKGRLAFSFGNVAQDEGSAMAQFAWSKGWKTASLATDTVIVYFKDVVKAFKARFTQLGGKIVAEESYQSLGSTNITNAVTRLNGKKADVIVTSTAGAFGALPQMISGLRTLGNNTPVLNSWAGDGTYWVTKEPQVTNYYFVTYASIFGDDPAQAVNALAKTLKAGTGGFVTGSAAIDGVVTAIKRSGGSTNGARLAATMEKFNKVPTLSGLVSFSPSLHSVFGRQYRVIQIQGEQGQAGRHRGRQGRPEDLSASTLDRGGRPVRERAARRSTPGRRPHALVRRCPRRPGRLAHAAPTRGRRADRTERRGQVDPREPPDRVRPPELGARRARRTRHHPLEREPPRPARARAHVPAQPSVPLALRPRERRSVGARRRRLAGGRPQHGGRAARPPGPRSALRRLPPGRSPTETSDGSASRGPSPRGRASSCSTSPRQGSPRPRCPSSRRSCARCATRTARESC